MRRLTAVIIASVLGVACGSKGDPLPPLRLAPAKAAGLTAARIEGRPITLQFVVPAANDDGSVPVDIAAMRVFAVTMPASEPAPTPLDLLGGDLLVATIDVQTPRADDARQTTGAPPPPPPAPAPGTPITWEDTTEIVTPATPMVRYYAVAGVSSRGRVGVASDVVAVPLTTIEGAPANLTASFTASAIKLDWLGVSAATRYRVYDAKTNVPLNAEPIEGTTFEVPIGAASADPGARPAYGVERCFLVRAARASGGASVESAAAGPVCVTPADVFPPPAPANLTAVASEGAMSLIWDAVDAEDLAGYLVLRGEATGDTLAAQVELAPLFAAPITDAMYKDTTIEAGKRYVYAVVAVDTATPANRSAESNRVEETGRQ